MSVKRVLSLFCTIMIEALPLLAIICWWMIAICIIAWVYQPEPQKPAVRVSAPTQAELVLEREIPDTDGMTFSQEAKVVLLAGMLLEESSKLWYVDKAIGSPMRQIGVQMQIAAMDDLDILSKDAVTAALQGFLVGL